MELQKYKKIIGKLKSAIIKQKPRSNLQRSVMAVRKHRIRNTGDGQTVPD
jgi:hypothetical protein